MDNSRNLIRKILIRDLELLCRIGVNEKEHLSPQRIIINIEVNLDIKCFPENDRIEETLNYDLIYSGIKKIVSSKHFNLLETLAGSIDSFLSTFQSVDSKSVSISKPDIYSDCKDVTYKISDLKK